MVAAMLVMGLSLAAAAALTGRRLHLPALAGFVVAFEGAGHWLLARLDGHGAGHLAMTAHQAHVSSVAVGATGGAAATAQLPSIKFDPDALGLQLPDGRMLLGHAVAAGVIVLLAWSADAALHRLEGALDRLLAVVFGPAFYVRPGLIPPGREGGLATDCSVPAPPPPAVALPALSHRGPPAALARVR